MKTSKEPNEIGAELKGRIQDDLDHSRGDLPDSYAIAWRAYLAGLLEWGVIDVSLYDSLLNLLPAVQDDPAISISLGRE